MSVLGTDIGFWYQRRFLVPNLVLVTDVGLGTIWYVSYVFYDYLISPTYTNSYLVKYVPH